MSHSLSNSIKFIALCALSITASSAFSHVTLDQQQVEANTTYKAILRVGHGCEGLPTTVLRVQIPAGFLNPKPMPKAGWTLQMIVGKLAAPYDSNGKQITEGVSEIVWTANSPDMAIKDSEYDEFVLRGRAAMQVGAAWFKVTQLCKDGAKEGSNPWTEIPTQGTSTRGLKYPAALLNVVAPSAVSATSAAAAPATTAPQTHAAPAAADPHAGHKH